MRDPQGETPPRSPAACARFKGLPKLLCRRIRPRFERVGIGHEQDQQTGGAARITPQAFRRGLGPNLGILRHVFAELQHDIERSQRPGAEVMPLGGDRAEAKARGQIPHLLRAEPFTCALQRLVEIEIAARKERERAKAGLPQQYCFRYQVFERVGDARYVILAHTEPQNDGRGDHA